MAIPGEWEALWQRRDSRERSSESGKVIPPSAQSPQSHRAWLGMVLIVVIFFYTTMRSLIAIFTGLPASTALRLSLCSSTTIGSHLGTDLLRAFLERQGAHDVRVSTDGGLTQIRAHLPGRFFETTVELRSDTSSQAFAALGRRECTLALIGRSIDPFEATQFHTPLSANLIALDGAVLVVNPTNPLRSVSTAAVQGIFAGSTQNWSRLGGKPGRITTVLPTDHADEFSTFVEHMLNGQVPTISSRHSDNVAQTVAAPGNTNALGLTTFHAADPAKILLPRSRDGNTIAASTLSIGRRTYPLVMPIYVYRDETAMTPAAYQFISFLDSDEGQDVVVADGFVSPFAF